MPTTKTMTTTMKMMRMMKTSYSMPVSLASTTMPAFWPPLRRRQRRRHRRHRCRPPKAQQYRQDPHRRYHTHCQHLQNRTRNSYRKARLPSTSGATTGSRSRRRRRTTTFRMRPNCTTTNFARVRKVPTTNTCTTASTTRVRVVDTTYTRIEDVARHNGRSLHAQHAVFIYDTLGRQRDKRKLH